MEKGFCSIDLIDSGKNICRFTTEGSNVLTAGSCFAFLALLSKRFAIHKKLLGKGVLF